jgi:hypothetical protein
MDITNKFMYNGIVEDRQDPLKLGRVRVRLVGIHNFNRQEVPIEALPWADTLFGTNINSIPKEGEWVLVYCQDGEPDYPVVLGVIPGIKLAEFNSQVGFGDPRTVEEKQNSPTWPEGTVAQKLDEPTTFRIGRADISDTPTKVANDDKEHVCNIQFDLMVDIYTVRMKVSSAIQWLRKQIESLFSATSESAFIQSVRAQIKQLLAKLKEIQKVLKEFNDFVLEIAKWTQQLKDLIAWILSLPTRLLVFLQECVNEFLSSVGAAVTGSFNVVDPSGSVATFSEVTKLVSTASETLSVAKETAENTVTVVAGVVAITDQFERV